MNELHFMLDIETLGLTDKAVVTEIAFVPFATKNNGVFVPTNSPPPFFEQISVLEQEKIGRIVEQKTADWWEKTNPTKYASFFAIDISPAFVVKRMKEYFGTLSHLGKPVIWARPPEFDCRVLADFITNCGEELFWEFHSTRCHRTAVDLTGVTHESNYLHHALADAYEQRNSLFLAFQILTDIEKLNEKTYGC